MRPLLITAIIVIGLIGAAVYLASGGGSKSIDGFPIGQLATCSGLGQLIESQGPTCEGLSNLATAALDTREPGHPTIASTHMYTDGGKPPGADSAVTVFVFTLADGTTRATGVSCTGQPSVCVGIGAYPR